MILKRYYSAIILSITGIVLTSILFALALLHLNHLFTILVTGALLLLQTVWLIRYMNRVNTTLEKFFLSIKNDDSNITFAGLGGTHAFDNLRSILDEVVLAIKRAKIEKEQQFQYLKNVTEHVNTGLIAFSDDGRVELFNRPARMLFNDFQPVLLSHLNRVHSDLDRVLIGLQPGQQELLTIKIGSEILQLSIRKSRFYMENRAVNLVSFQDIHHELDRKELASWQKLIRVLRHEIMNTVSPIVSMATTLSRIFGTREDPRNKDQLNEQNVKDTIEGLDIIRNRSKGLLDFVEHYSTLSRLPEPRLEEIKVQELLRNIITLFRTPKSNVEFRIDCHAELVINADRKLIEQVMINLVKNAVESMSSSDNPVLEITGSQTGDGNVSIMVMDNGPGIPQEVLPNIFVPFFSTREKGSGIGLSLSRQIMDIHRGKISVQSAPGKKTIFTLNFQ